MNTLSSDATSFSPICIELCKGKCCNPWWGIITYRVKKDGGLSHLRDEILAGIEERARRIVTKYVTSETEPRPLFKSPERYNITVENIEITGSSLIIDLRAMFAFRCRFLSEDKRCIIHPSLWDGQDIRPPHCSYLGSSDAKPGERGYCRIIHAASVSSGDLSKIRAAIDMEEAVSEKHYREGYPSPDRAADAVVTKIREYVRSHAPYLVPVEAGRVPGRNDPCHCGSGKKYKKCHGKMGEGKFSR